MFLRSLVALQVQCECFVPQHEGDDRVSNEVSPGVDQRFVGCWPIVFLQCEQSCDLVAHADGDACVSEHEDVLVAVVMLFGDEKLVHFVAAP